MFESADPTQTGNQSNEMPEGFHTKCELVKSKMATAAGSGRPYVSFTFKIHESENPAAVGAYGDFYEQLTGAKFASFDQQAQGRVLQLVGALSGLTAGESVGKVGAREVGLVTDAATQPFNGRLVQIRAKHVAKTAKGDNIARCESYPFKGSSIPSEVTQVKAVVPSAPAALPRFDHPAMPGHTYDASGAIFDASGKKVN